MKNFIFFVSVFLCYFFLTFIEKIYISTDSKIFDFLQTRKYLIFYQKIIQVMPYKIIFKVKKNGGGYLTLLRHY
ncbi:hypothetical protein SAMN05660493_02035 [Epilithonimonas bovis DSM 19482]|uniref:Uncharacterized protein n=1 Tax=Epilithonimonas bovis DSM 19482 TaxID=1121284 RepID=A0A1U7PWP8_9FLAO|nr:hypothetical protein SAMN05660493_02035 [Epilithonimonas bovis DSM 19482]